MKGYTLVWITHYNHVLILIIRHGYHLAKVVKLTN